MILDNHLSEESDCVTLRELKMDLGKWRKPKIYITRRHIWENPPYMCNKFSMCAQEIQIYGVDRTHILISWG